MTNLSRINIGSSNDRTKKYILTSKYKINQIITNPFGSTKMRFHYPSTFDCNIKELETPDDNYTYEIDIVRKEKNKDLSNSKYFVGKGWNIDLSITCITEDFQLNNEYILTYLPTNYGSVEVSNINDNTHKKYKAGIMVPTFGRLDYLKKCFESLKKTNLTNCVIIIVDESLTKNVDDDKIETNKYIREFNFAIPTIKIYKNVHGNMFDSINIGLDILGHVCEFIMTLDSDTIHNTNFVEKTLSTYEQVKSNNNDSDKLIVISGFNTSKHKIIQNDNLSYYIKETIGGCHLGFKTSDYWNYIRYTLISYKWDTNIYNLINRLGGVIASTKPSVVEHIGEVSSVRDDNFPYDKSIDFKSLDIRTKKIYIISEDIKLENGQTWIIDVFKNEFIEYSGLNFVNDPGNADIIWIVGINMEKIMKLKTMNLWDKNIITTIHHIDWNKIDNFNKSFNILNEITTKFHVICQKVYDNLIKITTKPIVMSNFWINENVFFSIPNKDELRKKYNIPTNAYCIGSFQRDTEGKEKCMKPKLSKGPDIFVSIVSDMKNKHPNLLVLLSGRRRNYIINELEKKSIKYLYFPMVNSNELNELYNCLDLYIVSSRVEGGPRAIIECGIANVPLISTNVGIAELILDSASIYNMNKPLTYSVAKPNTLWAYEKSSTYSIKNFINKFSEIVLS